MDAKGHHKYPYQRGRQRRWPCDRKGRDSSGEAISQGRVGPPEAERAINRVSARASGGSTARWRLSGPSDLDFELWPSALRTYISAVFSHHISVSCCSSHRGKRIQGSRVFEAGPGPALEDVGRDWERGGDDRGLSLSKEPPHLGRLCQSNCLH